MGDVAGSAATLSPMIRKEQGGSLLTIQQYALYLTAYLLDWRGPDVPRDADGRVLAPSDELIAGLDYGDPLDYAACQRAEALYGTQFLRDPSLDIQKKTGKHPRTRAGAPSLTPGADGSRKPSAS